MQPSH
jgi:hypothetical protein